jgi:hypothetical protein
MQTGPGNCCQHNCLQALRGTRSDHRQSKPGLGHGCVRVQYKLTVSRLSNAERRDDTDIANAPPALPVTGLSSDNYWHRLVCKPRRNFLVLVRALNLANSSKPKKVKVRKRLKSSQVT